VLEVDSLYRNYSEAEKRYEEAFDQSAKAGRNSTSGRPFLNKGFKIKLSQVATTGSI